MQLKQYPIEISKAAKIVQRLDKRIAIAKAALDRMNFAIEVTIAQDVELKNDQQRRARRMELQQEPAYAEHCETLQQLEWKRDAAQINLGCLRDSFRVEMLEMRERIARMEVNQLIA